MAVQSVFGGDIVWHSEIDKAASKVLAHRFPGVPNLGDITKINWANWKLMLQVDVLCGGFPCTDVSAAGKRAGMHGTRSGLWSHMAEAIDVLRPKYVVIENVRGLLNANANRPMESEQDAMGDRSDGSVLRAIGAVLGDLADLRIYDARWVTVAASSVGAPHRRERVFIVAQSRSAAVGINTGRTPSAEAGAHTSNRSGDHRGERADVDRLPTPLSGEARHGSPNQHRSRGDKMLTGVVLTEMASLLPTPRSSDCFGAGQHGDGGMDLRTTIDLLCTPTAGLASSGQTSRSGKRINEPLLNGQAREMASSWGKYEPAIRRWENIVGPAPAPTEPGKNGNPRLSAAFSEWLMGWPNGWVTNPAIGISRNDQLRIIGNGVVPQQATMALRQLLNGAQFPVRDVPSLLPTPSTHDKTGARSPESLAAMEKPFSNLNDVAVNELSVGGA
jgi:DNA (cytosine-5)-methyltransferase 1